MTLHITPLNDLKQHEQTTTCECEPSIETVNGNILVIHNSFDGREGLEMFNEIIEGIAGGC